MLVCPPGVRLAKSVKITQPEENFDLVDKPSSTELQTPLKTSIHEALFKCFCDACGGCERVIGGRGRLIDVTYQLQEVDLNEDGFNEIIAMGIECIYEDGFSPMGGVTGNKLFCVIQQKRDKWIQIGFFNGHNYSVKPTKTKGYYDITSQADIGGAGCFILISYFKWNGSYYVLAYEEEKNKCR